MGYGGVRKTDHWKDAVPTSPRKAGNVLPAGEDATAGQASGFTGKRTYDSGMAIEREKKVEDTSKGNSEE
jgi:hypothetical protein